MSLVPKPIAIKKRNQSLLVRLAEGASEEEPKAARVRASDACTQ